MIRKMVPRAGVALTAALVLSACGGGGSSPANPSPDAAANNATALDYSYPLNQQTQVPTPAPVVLDFSNSISGTDVASSISLHQVDSSGNIQSADVAVTSKAANNGKALILTPTDPLAPHTAYAVVINGSSVVKNRNIMFTTRAAQQGPESGQVSSDTMQLTSMFPNGSSDEPMMDFSTLRLDFSQPLDRSTVSYGNGPNDTVALMDGNDNVVPAHVLVDGPYLTIDPVKNLTPGENYTLRFVSDAVKSTYGKAFYYTDGGQWHFTPKSSLADGVSESQRPQPLVQKVTESGTSPLTGADTNLIPVNATLLGDNNNIQQSGNVLGDLAFLPKYPNISPLSIRRGTLLKGASIHVNIGGKVYAGFDTGEVDVRFLTDASGYLMPNPYDSSPNAPKLVKLEMDVAISAANSTANAGVTQNITHLELIGTAQTDTKLGVVNINAVGVVQPEILGQERGYGTLSFQLQSYPDQTNAPTVAKDTTPPTLQSWTFGDYQDARTGETESKASLYRQGDPIVFNFDEPLDSSSVKNAVTLYENGQAVQVTSHVDGAALVVQPATALKLDKEGNPISYEIQVSNAATDLSGNAIQPIDKTFSLPEVVVNNYAPNSGAPGKTVVRPPIPLATYPGFPCALTDTNLSQNDAGRCLGGFPGWDQGVPKYDIKPEDDHLPIQTMPSNQPIIVEFSKDVAPDSVALGKTFLVQKIDDQGNVEGDVDGQVVTSGNRITFTPSTPWMNGQLYQYVLKSNGGGEASIACDGTVGICGTSGLAIQTRLLSDLQIKPIDQTSGITPIRDYQFIATAIPDDAGGPDLIEYFKGGDASNNVIQILTSAPSADINKNFIHEQNPSNENGASPLLFDTPLGNIYSYDTQEPGAANQPVDENADQTLDPNGVIPPPNSAKVLSKNRLGQPGTNTLAPAVNGVNFGCGYSDAEYVDPTNPYAGATKLAALSCPTRKFTYLTSDLVAAVTDQYTEGKGIKVLIWPGQIMGTALHIYTQEGNFPFIVITSSGAQLLRMRYAQGDNPSGPVDRDAPIIGWIKSENGEPTLTASVDLYMDGIQLTQNLPYNNPSHTLFSQPITMNLSGKIHFLDNGQMVIDQYNLDPVNFDVQLSDNTGLNAGQIDMEIPAYGNRLMYISQSIK